MMLRSPFDNHSSDSTIRGEASPASKNPQDHRRILVIDDEESVLEILKRALEARGYQVDACDSGEMGLAHLSRNPYSLIICDLRLPDTAGVDVFKVVKSDHAELIHRMIFTTGDILSPDVQQFLDESESPILKKPFELAELYRLVHAVMERGEP